jgi:hypothetical protein
MTIGDRLMVDGITIGDVTYGGHFRIIGYTDIGDHYHMPYFNVVIPGLIIIIGAAIYLTRFRGRLRYNPYALTDALAFMIPAWLLIGMGSLDFLYYVGFGEIPPQTLPWMNQTLMGRLLQVIRGPGDVTRLELVLSVAATNLFFLYFKNRAARHQLPARIYGEKKT